MTAFETIYHGEDIIVNKYLYYKGIYFDMYMCYCKTKTKEMCHG